MRSAIKDFKKVDLSRKIKQQLIKTLSNLVVMARYPNRKNLSSKTSLRMKYNPKKLLEVRIKSRTKMLRPS